MDSSLSASRLLTIIQTQNEIAATALDLDAVMSLVVERARALTGAEAAVVELVEGDELVYHVAHGAAAPFVGLRLRADASLSGLCAQEGRTVHCADASADDRVDLEACRRLGAVSMVCAPLSHEGRVVGVLEVYDARANLFSQEDVATLDLLSGVIAAHMAHATDLQEHHLDSRHDPLTGLPNRRAFDERLEEELARASRHGAQFTVCLLDLDGFEQLNDYDGRSARDAVLWTVAANFSQLRGEDAAYRLGEDEFALVLVETYANGAEGVAERITAAIRQDPACRGVGVSWGVATYQFRDTAASIVARADKALYEAKQAG
jgi:diguanylate cyclase